MPEFSKHHLRVQGRDIPSDAPPDVDANADLVRSWLTALVGAEHLSLLVGSGLSIGVSNAAGVRPLSMSRIDFALDESDKVNAHAAASAAQMNRGEPNIEDQLRSALQLLAGLEVLDPGADATRAWRETLIATLTDFAKRGLKAEAEVRAKVESGTSEGARAAQLLVGLLLAFASRAPSRERLNLFTTNYDRLLEYGCDLGGLRAIDRFAGTVEPVFRSSRLEVDLHYNPPGIRGEPRYLEGVLRLYKLHGSLDWRFANGQLRRIPLAFGASDPLLDRQALERLIIYPNAAKDVETLLYPYADLFRDLSAALCRPNGVLVTIGYGFGDDHINRVIRDMLTLRSTHLLVISYDDPGGRIASFLSSVAPEQYSVLLGSHFGDLGTLVDNYVPRPGSEQLLLRQAAHQSAMSTTNPATHAPPSPTTPS